MQRANSMEMEENMAGLRAQLADFSRRSFQRGLISGTGGNISVRIPGSDRVLVTPSGLSLAEVRPENSILVSLDGQVVAAPEGLKPSKETSFHLAVYRLRPDVMAIVHLHPAYATAYANLGQPLPLVTVSARANFPDGVPCIESGWPGSVELRQLVEEAARQHPQMRGLLMKEHGILTLGPDLPVAYYRADLLEDTARIAFLTRSLAGR